MENKFSKFKKLFILPQNYHFFWRFFLINLLIFAIFRLIFILTYHAQFSGVPLGYILKSFFVGARFDIYVINYGIAPFFLIGCLPYIGLEYSEKSKKVYATLMSILFGIFYIMQLGDIEFYRECNSHLNFTAIEYTKSSGFMIYMMSKYHIVRYVFIFIAILILYKYLIKKFVLTVYKPKVSILKRLILYPFFLGMIFVGIRGSVSLGIMDWGEAFFSQYNIVNQATLNPIFNFTKDLYYIKKNNDVEKFHYFKDPKESLKIAQKLLIQEDEQKNLIFPDYPLYRIIKRQGAEKKYNVVIILMESFTAEYIGCLGNKLNLSPNFDRLAKGGVLFSNFYSAGQRTNAGISSTVCSYIPVSGHSIMSRVEGQQKIPTIASILKDKGYASLFVYGGDTQFDNMQGFLVPKGFDRVINQYDFPQSLVLNKWGILDEFVFDKMLNEIDGIYKQKKPFVTMMLTLTNHPPYTVPNVDFGRVKTGSDLDNSYNTFKYSDYALGKFFDKIKTRDYFNDTIFVICGDHAQTLHHDLDFEYRKSYVPCLIYAPKILKPNASDKLCGQIDIAPTIFSVLNMSTENAFCGKDMLKPKNSEKDFAIILSGSDMGYLKNGFFYYTRVGDNRSPKLYKFNDFSTTNYKDKYPDIFKSMEREAFALEESTYRIFKNRKIAK